MEELIMEFALWFIMTCIIFIVLNRVVGLRTAASIILSLLLASIIIFIIYKNLFAEISVSIATILIFFYGIIKALRDLRDDPEMMRKLEKGF